MQYYPVVKHWSRKIRPHLGNPELQRVLVRDFNKYTVGRSGRRFRAGRLPREFDSCDRRWSVRGRHPAYFDYVRHGACHWLVNFNLRLAELAEPRRWRILTSDKHSTVWDGDSTLFDMQFLAMGVSAEDSFKSATEGPDAEELAIGRLCDVGLPDMEYQREIIGLRIKTIYGL